VCECKMVYKSDQCLNEHNLWNWYQLGSESFNPLDL